MRCSVCENEWLLPLGIFNLRVTVKQTKILLNIWPKAWHNLVYTCKPRIWQLATGGSGIQGYSWLCGVQSYLGKKKKEREREGGGWEMKWTNWSELFVVSFGVNMFEHLKSQRGEHFSQTVMVHSILMVTCDQFISCWVLVASIRSSCDHWTEVDEFGISLVALLSEGRSSVKLMFLLLS